MSLISIVKTSLSDTTPEVTGFDLSKGSVIVSGIDVDLQTASVKIFTTKLTLESQHKLLHFYSDGSLKNCGRKDVSMGFASVFSYKGAYRLAVVGRSHGPASSSKAELAGLMASILCCPRNRSAVIHVDNQSVVNQFHTLVQQEGIFAEHRRIRSPGADWWQLIHEAYQRQGKKIETTWVRAHNGSAGNTAADTWARKAHTSGLASWKFSVKHRL